MHVQDCLRAYTGLWKKDPAGKKAEKSIEVWANEYLAGESHVKATETLDDCVDQCLALSKLAKLSEQATLEQLCVSQDLHAAMQGSFEVQDLDDSLEDPSIIRQQLSPQPRSSALNRQDASTAGLSDPEVTKELIALMKDQKEQSAVNIGVLKALAQQNQGMEPNNQDGDEPEGIAAGIIPTRARGGGGGSLIVGKMGLDFPEIQDNDTDFDTHWHTFMSIIDCYRASGRVVTPYEIMMMLKRTLPMNSTRRREYDTIVEQARLSGKLPDKAQEVLKEIKEKLEATNVESSFQKMIRLSSEFENLQQGKSPHYAFRALFEKKVYQMQRAGMYQADDVENLRTKYLIKIKEEMRSTIMRNTWPLDGERDYPRKPKTWQEVAKCVEWELQSRADSRAPLQKEYGHERQVEYAHAGAEEGSPMKCNHCGKPGHFKEQCFRRACEIRGMAGLADKYYQEKGTVCPVCFEPGHFAEDHRFASHYAAQWYTVSGNQIKVRPPPSLQSGAQQENGGGGGKNSGKNGGKGAGKGGGKGSPKGAGKAKGASDLSGTQCPRGVTCHFINNDANPCWYWHSKNCLLYTSPSQRD